MKVRKLSTQESTENMSTSNHILWKAIKCLLSVLHCGTYHPLQGLPTIIQSLPLLQWNILEHQYHTAISQNLRKRCAEYLTDQPTEDNNLVISSKMEPMSEPDTPDSKKHTSETSTKRQVVSSDTSGRIFKHKRRTIGRH